MDMKIRCAFLAELLFRGVSILFQKRELFTIAHPSVSNFTSMGNSSAI